MTKVEAQSLRQDIANAQRALNLKGLSSGASGNVSAKISPEGMLITPTGVASDVLHAEQVVEVGLKGEVAASALRPSSEWQIHADIYASRADINAIVHCHSPYATMLACVGKPIPALHYMIALSGSNVIPLARYERFGTQALSAAVLDAMAESKACLMANHGQIVGGESVSAALALAQQVEELAHWYWGVLAMGAAPVVLDDAQMLDVHTAFSSYGQQD